MYLQGVDFISDLALRPHFQAKMVFNEAGAIFFPTACEHRDQSGPSISYADNYKGNALAAMISPGLIEVRYHNAFTDAAVASILSEILSEPGLACMAGWKASYQGRDLRPES